MQNFLTSDTSLIILCFIVFIAITKILGLKRNPFQDDSLLPHEEHDDSYDHHDIHHFHDD